MIERETHTHSIHVQSHRPRHSHTHRQTDIYTNRYLHTQTDRHIHNVLPQTCTQSRADRQTHG